MYIYIPFFIRKENASAKRKPSTSALAILTRESDRSVTSSHSRVDIPTWSIQFKQSPRARVLQCIFFAGLFLPDHDHLQTLEIYCYQMNGWFSITWHVAGSKVKMEDKRAREVHEAARKSPSRRPDASAARDAPLFKNGPRRPAAAASWSHGVSRVRPCTRVPRM